MLKVKDVDYLNDYRLALLFSDGVKKEEQNGLMGLTWLQSFYIGLGNKLHFFRRYLRWLRKIPSKASEGIFENG